MLETSSQEEIVIFCMSHALIKSEVKCLTCDTNMSLKPSRDNPDGFNWRCMTYTCRTYQTTSSIKNTSYFESVQKPLKEILKVLAHIANKLKLVEVQNYTKFSKPTIQKLKNIFIERIEDYFFKNPVKLGGPRCIVNVDESMINHAVKSHRGRSPREKTWALSIVDTSFSPSSGFCCVLPNRRAETIIPIISSVVRHGSIIYTDEFASYITLGRNSNYEHFTVCHKYNFVCSTSGVHTQAVESYNNKLKLFIKEKKGVKAEKRSLLCLEFMFFDKFGRGNIDMLFLLFKCN